MERFSWWRMEQVQHPLSRALCGAFCSILHHVKRSMSHPPKVANSALPGSGNAPNSGQTISSKFVVL